MTQASDPLDARLRRLADAVPAKPAFVDAVLQGIEAARIAPRPRTYWLARAVNRWSVGIGAAACVLIGLVIWRDTFTGRARVDQTLVKDCEAPAWDAPATASARDDSTSQSANDFDVFFHVPSARELAMRHARWGFIDKQGRIVVSARYEGVHAFSEGLAAVRRDGKWGFIDRRGRMAIAPQFDDVQDFHDGLAAVLPRLADLGDWGYIDQKGRMVLPPKYHRPGSFDRGLAQVFIGIDLKRNSFAEGVFIDRTGAVVVKPEPGVLACGPFSNDRDLGFNPIIEEQGPIAPDLAVCVRHEGNQARFGFMDRSGRVVINTRFRYARGFVHGVAPVQHENARYGLIDKTGRFIVKCNYTDVIMPRDADGLVAMWQQEKPQGYALFDLTGRQIAPPRYEHVTEFSEGLGFVYDPATKERGFIDATGRLVLPEPAGISMSAPFFEGLARVDRDDGPAERYGFVDRTGTIVILCKFEDVGRFSEGLAPYAAGLKWKRPEVPRPLPPDEPEAQIIP